MLLNDACKVLHEKLGFSHRGAAEAAVSVAVDIDVPAVGADAHSYSVLDDLRFRFLCLIVQ